MIWYQKLIDSNTTFLWAQYKEYKWIYMVHYSSGKVYNDQYLTIEFDTGNKKYIHSFSKHPFRKPGILISLLPLLDFNPSEHLVLVLMSYPHPAPFNEYMYVIIFYDITKSLSLISKFFHKFICINIYHH